MLIGIKIQSNEYWKSTWAFMKMLKSGMEHTYDTNFEMEINQQILADQFNEMIPNMYALMQWGINNEENVVHPEMNYHKNGDNGTFTEPKPQPTVFKRLTDEQLMITTDDILIDEEVIEYMNKNTVKTPNGRFANIECGNTFFLYNTADDTLTYY